ncbi:MAG TPA: hypothetical protein VFP33_09445 [Gallionella sp.]|nr:hypothetical protein [Gallionella sp.]
MTHALKNDGAESDLLSFEPRSERSLAIRGKFFIKHENHNPEKEKYPNRLMQFE